MPPDSALAWIDSRGLRFGNWLPDEKRSGFAIRRVLKIATVYATRTSGCSLCAVYSLLKLQPRKHSLGEFSVFCISLHPTERRFDRSDRQRSQYPANRKSDAALVREP